MSEIREYERTSTTVANVYVQELAEAYLDELLQRRLAELGYRGELYIMLSSGGISTVEHRESLPDSTDRVRAGGRGAGQPPTTASSPASNG